MRNPAVDDDYISRFLGTKRFGTLQRVVNTAATGLALYELGKKWRDRGRAAYEHSIAVPATDEIYAAVHEYVLAQLRPTRRRSMTLRSYLGGDDDSDFAAPVDPGNGGKRRTGHVKLFYDGSREQRIKVNGHTIRVCVEQDDSRDDDNRRKRGMLYKRERIIFYAATTAGREAVITWLRELAVARNIDTRSRLFIGMSWGGWSRLDQRAPARPLETVILPHGQRERILADLEQFLTDESRYARVGKPWHRGYLFHGPPGTGKTSLAKALAEHLELDLYYIPLSDLREDANLIELLAGVSPRSVLILEDIDVVHAAKSRDDSDVKGVTLSGLLQALDGMITPHGLITILTTNNRKRLDTALIRAGRVDVKEHLGYVDDDQARRLVEAVLDRPLTRELPPTRGRKIVPADLIGPATVHLHDPDAAEKAIFAQLEDLEVGA